MPTLPEQRLDVALSVISSAEATPTMCDERLSGTVCSAPNSWRRAVVTGTTAVSS